MKASILTFFTAAIVIGSIGTGAGQNTASPGPPAAPATGVAAKQSLGPRIQFATPIYDFGKVSAGQMVKYDFVFTNVGDQTLEISAVQPGCGCTTAGNWDKTVEPGKTGIIPIQYNSAAFGGPVVKSVTVNCNDPTHASTILQIKGTVWKPIDITPTYAIFMPFAEDPTNETKVVRITNNQEELLNLSPPECNNSAFKAELKTLVPGKDYELAVTTVPPFSSGNVSAAISIKTSSSNTPVITVSAIVMLQQAIAIQPSQIILQPGPLAGPMRPTVTIRNNSVTTNALVLSDPQANIPGVDVQIQEVQPGRQFTLTVGLPAGFQIQPGQQVEASVKSNHPKFPLIKVPVFQPQMPPTTPTRVTPVLSAPPTSLTPAMPPAPWPSGTGPAIGPPPPPPPPPPAVRSTTNAATMSVPK